MFVRTICLIISCLAMPLLALGQVAADSKNATKNPNSPEDIKIEFQDYGTRGHLFEIKEDSLLEEIMAKLNAAQADGSLEKLQEEFTSKVKAKILRPTPVEGVNSAQREKSWTYDPSYTQETTIVDDKGRVIVAAGTKVNALDKVHNLAWGEPMIFIDGDDKKQVAWAIKQQAKIVLTKGAPLELMKSLKRSIYFDQGGMLCRRFKIEATPAIITQEGNLLRIREVKL